MGWDIGILWQHAVEQTKVYLAKALEQPTSIAYSTSAEMLLWQGHREEALAEIDRAIALDPNDSDAYVTKAWILTASGRAAEAEENTRVAMWLNPAFAA